MAMVANKKAVFVTIVDRACPLIQSTHCTEASFSPNLMDSLCLQVIQVPRSRKVAIFVVTMTTLDDTTNY